MIWSPLEWYDQSKVNETLLVNVKQTLRQLSIKNITNTTKSAHHTHDWNYEATEGQSKEQTHLSNKGNKRYSTVLALLN